MIFWPAVSNKTKPGNSHGKPPSKTNLKSSNRVRRLAKTKLFIKKLASIFSNLIIENGAINTIDNKDPIIKIILIDIIIDVLKSG